MRRLLPLFILSLFILAPVSVGKKVESKKVEKKVFTPKFKVVGGKLLASTKTYSGIGLAAKTVFDTVSVESGNDSVVIEWYNKNHYYVKPDWKKIKSKFYLHQGTFDTAFADQFGIGMLIGPKGEWKDSKYIIDRKAGTYECPIPNGWILDPGYEDAPDPAGISFGFEERGDSTVNYTDAANLAHLWTLNTDTTSATTYDSAGSSDGTLVGGAQVSVAQKKFGNASLLLDGTDDRVTFGSLAAINNQANVTISFWMYQNDIDIFDYLFRTVVDGSNLFQIYTDATGNYVIDIRNGGVTYGLFDYSDYIEADTWHHCLMRYEGGGAANADRLRFFVDGVEVTLSYTGTIPATMPDLSSASWTVGNSSNSFDGYLDNIKIWSAAIDEEICVTDAKATIEKFRTIDTTTTGLGLVPIGSGNIDSVVASSTEGTLDYLVSEPIVKLVSKQIGTSTGDLIITHDSLNGLIPVAMFAWWTNATGTGTIANMEYGQGIATLTDEYCHTAHSRDNISSSSTATSTNDTLVLIHNNRSGGVSFRGEFVEFIPNGVVIDRRNASGQNIRINVLLIAGNAEVHAGYVPYILSSNTASIEDPGFEPDALIFLSARAAFTGANGGASAGVGTGFCVNDGSETQRSIYWYEVNGNAGGGIPIMRMSDTVAAMRLSNTSGNSQNMIKVTGFDADGFNIRNSGSSVADSQQVYLAIKIKSSVELLDANSPTSEQADDYDVDFTPQLALGINTWFQTTDLNIPRQSDRSGGYTLWGHDGDSTFSTGFAIEDGADPTDTRARYDVDSVRVMSDNGGSFLDMHPAFTDTSVTLDWTDVTFDNRLGFMLVFEEGDPDSTLPVAINFKSLIGLDTTYRDSTYDTTDIGGGQQSVAISDSQVIHGLDTIDFRAANNAGTAIATREQVAYLETSFRENVAYDTIGIVKPAGMATDRGWWSVNWIGDSTQYGYNWNNVGGSSIATYATQYQDFFDSDSANAVTAKVLFINGGQTDALTKTADSMVDMSLQMLEDLEVIMAAEGVPNTIEVIHLGSCSMNVAVRHDTMTAFEEKWDAKADSLVSVYSGSFQYRWVAGPSGPWRVPLDPDGIHLLLPGYEAWVDSIGNALRKYMPLGKYNVTSIGQSLLVPRGSEVGFQPQVDSAGFAYAPPQPDTTDMDVILPLNWGDTLFGSLDTIKSIGGARKGYLNNTAWSNMGEYRSCLEFNGNNSTVQFPDGMPELDGAADAIISFWMNQDVLDQLDRIIRYYLDASNEFSIYTFTDGTLTIQFSGGNYGQYDYSLSVNAGQWHNITIVYDGGGADNAARLKLYIDGIQKTLTFGGTIPATMDNTAGAVFQLGHTTGSFDGKLDHLIITNSNFPLMPSDLPRLYSARANLSDKVDTTSGIVWINTEGTGADSLLFATHTAASNSWVVPKNETCCSYDITDSLNPGVLDTVWVRTKNAEGQQSPFTSYIVFVDTFKVTPQPINGTFLGTTLGQWDIGDLVHTWNFELDTASAVTADSIGSSNGTLAGGAIVSDSEAKVGSGALDVSTNGWRVLCGQVPQIQDSSTYTIMAYLYHNDLGAQQETWWTVSADADNVISSFVFTDGTMRLWKKVAGTATQAFYNISQEINDSEWYHVAWKIDWDGATNADAVKLFINGQEKPLTFDGDMTTGTSVSGASNFIIGQNGNSFDGYIDQVQIWNKDLGDLTIATQSVHEINIPRGADTTTTGKIYMKLQEQQLDSVLLNVGTTDSMGTTAHLPDFVDASSILSITDTTYYDTTEVETVSGDTTFTTTYDSMAQWGNNVVRVKPYSRTWGVGTLAKTRTVYWLAEQRELSVDTTIVTGAVEGGFYKEFIWYQRRPYDQTIYKQKSPYGKKEDEID